MKFIKLLSLIVFSALSLGLNQLPLFAQSSNWEASEEGTGYSSIDGCVPTMSLPSGVDDCGNDLTSEPDVTQPPNDYGSLSDHVYWGIRDGVTPGLIGAGAGAVTGGPLGAAAGGVGGFAGGAIQGCINCHAPQNPPDVQLLLPPADVPYP